MFRYVIDFRTKTGVKLSIKSCTCFKLVIDLQVQVSMFSCFFLLDRRRCSLGTLAAHLVGFPTNTFDSECIISHDERTCHACSSTVINTLANKLLSILLENTDNNPTTYFCSAFDCLLLVDNKIRFLY